MATALSVLVVAVVVSWTLITVLNHLEGARRLVRPLTSYDICAAIPIWTFFAPNPGRTDVYLLYRDRDAEGQITAWRDIAFERRRAWWCLWNPSRRIGKGVVDVTTDLTSDTEYAARALVNKKKVVEFPYVLLLNYVCRQPADFRAGMRQFAVARTQGHGTEHDPEVVFLSAFHRLK